MGFMTFTHYTDYIVCGERARALIRLIKKNINYL